MEKASHSTAPQVAAGERHSQATSQALAGTTSNGSQVGAARSSSSGTPSPASRAQRPPSKDWPATKPSSGGARAARTAKAASRETALAVARP